MCLLSIAECLKFKVTLHDGNNLLIEPNITTERITEGQCFATCFDFPGCTAIGFDTSRRRCYIYTGSINASDSSQFEHDASTTIFIFDCDGMSLNHYVLVNLIKVICSIQLQYFFYDFFI